MPSRPSAAQVELAEQATEADWPTSASQVHELQERKVLPASVVTRRGRGKTTSEFPPGTLDVLIAVRRATKFLRDKKKYKPYRAVVLAWLSGADVQDGDPVRDMGLRWSLLRWVDEAHYQASNKGPRREHRQVDLNDGSPFGLDAAFSDPSDRRNVLAAAAALVRGEQLDPALAEALAPVMAELFKAIAAAAGQVAPELATAPLPDDRVLYEGVRELLKGRQPPWDPDPGGALDLSATTAAKIIAEASRQTLDNARDVVIALLGSEALGTLNGNMMAVGMILGQLAASPMAGSMEPRGSNQREE